MMPAPPTPTVTLYLDYSHVGLSDSFRTRCRPAMRAALHVGDLVVVEGDGAPDALARVRAVDSANPDVEFEFVRR